MNNVIQRIINHDNLDEIFNYALNKLFSEGPNDTTVLEILTYLSIYAPEEFKKYENTILKYMCLNYKDTKANNLKEAVFGMYKKELETQFLYSYTPVQACIVKSVDTNKCFSFSAPTSTGKSFVFRNIINSSEQDVVIVVPSRALINEYFHRLTSEITDKSINILTFIDKINCLKAKRNVFIVTPERCKELFKHKDDFNVEYFLFDEAQLSDENSMRGMYFDSIVRRAQNTYPNSKFVFAHPFVDNPDAQIIKNHFDTSTSSAVQFEYKNVGQVFYTYDKGSFYHFGIDKTIMGDKKILSQFDPMEKAIKSNGSVLIYTTKASIYKGKVFEEFKRYTDMCEYIKDKTAHKLIDKVKSYLGATDEKGKDKYSNLVNMLRRGIVVHHGSLPLQARMILEEFTQKGFCRICFATSTLEQGINMPFEVVFLNTFAASKPLSLKNLIGRAGRSTKLAKFDYGSIAMHNNNMSTFRNIMREKEVLKTVSLLDEDEISEDYKDFRDAIVNNTFLDEYNLTPNQVEKLSTDKTHACIKSLLERMYSGNDFLSLDKINADTDCKLLIYDLFQKIYEIYLERKLGDGEKSVFNTAIKIMLWKIHCKTFKDICFYRYAYASKLKERKEIDRILDSGSPFEKQWARFRKSNLYAAFVSECHDLPDSNIKLYNMFGYNETKAYDVDYDRIVFDTYDYLDKVIGFKLSDIFYTAFKKYFDETQDERAEQMAKYIKYGTDEPKTIWMLRYGFSFEDIDWLYDYIDSIDENQIIFKSSITDLDADKYKQIERFV